MSELRSSLRIRSFLRGEIIYANGASKTECTVRDISDLGARIQIPESVTVPEYFDLSIPQRGTCERVKTMWRRGNEIGVNFERAAQRSDGPDGHSGGLEPAGNVALRLRELEDETAKLRQQLATMRAMVEQVYKERA